MYLQYSVTFKSFCMIASRMLSSHTLSSAPLTSLFCSTSAYTSLISHFPFLLPSLLIPPPFIQVRSPTGTDSPLSLRVFSVRVDIIVHPTFSLYPCPQHRHTPLGRNYRKHGQMVRATCTNPCRCDIFILVCLFVFLFISSTCYRQRNYTN